MIVSASYRTDIPAFYGRWFLNRFRAGWVKAINPYGRQISTIPLRAGVDGYVFWSRNAAPFQAALDEVRAAGFPFILHHTVTGYPRRLERSVIDPARAVAVIRDLAARHGSGAVVWRYDPVLITSMTPPSWHLETFAALADALAGAVDEVVVSFAHLYRKTERNLTQTAALGEGFEWVDPPREEKQALLTRLAGVARARGMKMSLCAQQGLVVPEATPGRCIDARRLERVAAEWGNPRSVSARPRGTRPGCQCHESRDIGEYDTCPHGCAYCYAVGSRELARKRFSEHDPDSEFLFCPPGSIPLPEIPSLL
ncbi:DUF1848 domain-containing protein [Magnetospirillum molischianum]|uniref:DNA repair photolyase n=1 Tax=Magnetospirillum molischianum DSM 120 TaxID=1150626 RepID=H8FRP9_MAGML|nr:DUF1848 domain-containing protein [Magnetospirillum molischianum]CCG41037.1 conserved hypothetical protein [Magnetospirillum molischianum DSM 120]